MALTKVSVSMIEGVTGASSSNSASANTAAINAALSSGAKLVALLNDGGTYLINATLVVPTGVSFIGIGQPTIKMADGSYPSGGTVISLTSTTGSLVDGFVINANRQNNGSSMNGIFCTNVVNTNVQNCYLTNTTYGIRYTNGNSNKILNNVVDNCLTYGISVKLASTSDSAYNYLINGNECRNIATDGTSGADGQGIVVYGATGASPSSYKNITDVIVSDNICNNCAAHGITMIAVSDFNVTDNNCYDCLQNTFFGSGICISEACKNGTVSGNTCTHNYDAGILLDVVDQTGDRFSYGYLSVTGNSCDRNVRAGIKINSMPHTTVSGNVCANSAWGIFLAKGGFNNIVGNSISYCSENGIRLPGIAGATGDDQTHVVIADNVIDHCIGTAGDQYSAIFVDYFNVVKIQNNDFYSNTQDLTIQSTCSGITLLDNRFTSNLYIDTSISVQRWEDEFRTTATGKTWYSNDFAGDGLPAIRVDAAFTIPHFGLEWVPLTTVSSVTSSLTNAIYAGYVGQKLRLINYAGTYSITIKHGANTKNIGNADIVLATGETVEYEYTGSVWLQTVAKVATSL